MVRKENPRTIKADQLQPGDQPFGWRIETVIGCTLNKRASVGKVKQQRYKKQGKYPIVDQSQKLIAGFWDQEEDVYKGNLPVVVFGDHTRIVKYIDFPFVCGADGTRILIPDTQIVFPLFLYYSLLFIDIPSRGYNRHYSLLKDRALRLPPLPEQKSIAVVLSAIQESKERTKQVIGALRELKTSLMKHLFDFGPVRLEEIGKVNRRETEVGLIPKTWKITKISDVVENTPYVNARRPLSMKFRYVDVSSVNNVSLKIELTATYEGRKAPSRARKWIKNGDVIIATVRPTLKRIALIGPDLDGQICSTAFCVLRANSGAMDNKYLFYAIQRDAFIENLGKLQRGASYPAVTDKDVKSQKIPLPDPSDQLQISLILSALDERIAQEEKKAETLAQLFQSMLHYLMTGIVRVNHLKLEVGHG